MVLEIIKNIGVANILGFLRLSMVRSRDGRNFVFRVSCFMKFRDFFVSSFMFREKCPKFRENAPPKNGDLE